MSYQRPKFIVMIDDDSMMNEIVGGYLKQAGYEVHVSSTPEAGFQSIVQHKPDLIILDRHLGQIDGTDLLIKSRVVKGCELIPVLMLTGEARKGQVMKALHLGVNDYLTKPFVPQELLAKVKKLLEQPKDDL